MTLTCPRCGAKAIPVGWLDCLSSASVVVPRRCLACNGEVKRRWFSWPAFVAGIPMMLGLLPMILPHKPDLFPLACLGIGTALTLLLRGFWVPFALWPKPIFIPPVVIPPEDEA